MKDLIFAIVVSGLAIVLLYYLLIVYSPSSNLPPRRIGPHRGIPIKDENYKCKCINVDMGSYSRQTLMIEPFNGKRVGIDTCLVQEIAELWADGIETLECCCGHNKTTGYIAVRNNSKLHKKMLEKGYVIIHSKHHDLPMYVPKFGSIDFNKTPWHYPPSPPSDRFLKEGVLPPAPKT